MIGTFFISNQSTNYEQILIIIPVMGARGSEIDQPPCARFLQPGITPNASSQLPFFFPWDGFNVRARVMDVICASVSRERGGEDPAQPHGQTFFFFPSFFTSLFFPIPLPDDGLTGHYAFAEFQHSDFAPTS